MTLLPLSLMSQTGEGENSSANSILYTKSKAYSQRQNGRFFT